MAMGKFALLRYLLRPEEVLSKGFVVLIRGNEVESLRRTWHL